MVKGEHYIFDASDPYEILIAGMRYSASTEEAAVARAWKELEEWQAMGRQYETARVLYRRDGTLLHTLKLASK